MLVKYQNNSWRLVIFVQHLIIMYYYHLFPCPLDFQSCAPSFVLLPPRKAKKEPNMLAQIHHFGKCMYVCQHMGSLTSQKCLCLPSLRGGHLDDCRWLPSDLCLATTLTTLSQSDFSIQMLEPLLVKVLRSLVLRNVSTGQLITGCLHKPSVGDFGIWQLISSYDDHNHQPQDQEHTSRSRTFS